MRAGVRVRDCGCAVCDLSFEWLVNATAGYSTVKLNRHVNIISPIASTVNTYKSIQQENQANGRAV